jgi:hypothetical protein
MIFNFSYSQLHARKTALTPRRKTTDILCIIMLA